MSSAWEEMELKLAVQEAKGEYEKLLGQQGEGHSDRLDTAVWKAGIAVEEAYHNLKKFNETK